MGRPLNKRLFGVAGVGPTAGGTEIKVNFHNGTAVKEGYIVKQLGSKKFRVEEIGTSGTFVHLLQENYLRLWRLLKWQFQYKVLIQKLMA